jgi:putative nucleotidyltransferase with HDIG domain
MSMQIKREISPYRRFTFILGASVLAIGAALAIATIIVINSFVVQDTIDFTKSAVQDHFAVLPPLKGVFADDKSPTSTASGYDNGTNDNDKAANAMAAHGMTQDYGGLNALVRLHFDLYNFVSTRFYYPDGMITYSYDRNELGTMLPAAEQKSFARALAGGTIQSRVGTHGLHMWVPIQNDAKKVIGIVELTRNIAPQDASSRNVIINLVIVMLIGLLALFFALRQVYIRSTRTIDRKNQELVGMVDRIESTYDQSLQALSSALDFRDNETQGHSFRVTSYAIRLGQELGIQGQQLGLLARGALLHDVGKIGVPDAILLKPGKLTDEEWVTMKKHVEIGNNMLSHIEFLQPSLDVVKHHHESWDGSGYPGGLKAEQIPLFARIFALCDTYDAITSDRPYRKGRGHNEARAEIERCSASQFSPEVVAAFLRIPEAEWTRVLQMDPVEYEKQRHDLKLFRTGTE